jgi:hypothetical protein
MKTVILAFALALTSAAHAASAPTTLFTMADDRDAIVVNYTLLVDGDNVTGFQMTPGQTKANDTFTAAQVAAPAGVVVLSGQGHNVLFLQGAMDAKSGEGRFHLKYLANGLTNNYSTCDFLVKKSGSNYFAANAYTGARITSAKIITWSLGLKTLQGICQ